jgi:hypothetical protein
MPILASEITKLQDVLLRAGPLATLALASAGIVVLAYAARAVENYIRHLHHKSYLHFASPRFLLAVAGYALVADGFLIGAVFDLPFPLPVATITVSVGLILLITSAVLSILPLIRQVREIRETRENESADNHEEKH